MCEIFGANKHGKKFPKSSVTSFSRIIHSLCQAILKENSGVSTSWTQMKEHEKSKRMGHH